MSDEQTVCCQCGAHAPHSNTNYTLISQTGWRLTRARSTGAVVMEWRCPACWAKRRKATSRSSWPTGH